MSHDFAFQGGIDFRDERIVLHFRRGPDIDEKFATIGNLIARESAADLRHLWRRVDFHRGESGDVARGFVNRVLAKVRVRYVGPAPKLAA